MRGTTSILNSALKHGNTLNRLELTTVLRFFTESDWNDGAVEAVKTKGSAAGPFVIYCVSKMLAERAESEISWDLAVINPS